MWRVGFAVLVVLAAAGRAWAGDAVKVDGFTYSGEVQVEGIKEGQLAVQLRGKEKLFELGMVERISLENQKDFNAAEDGQSEAKAAAGLYQKAIGEITDRQLKLVAEWRGARALDAAGRWTEAVKYFLEVYQASPTEGVWKLRPRNMPAAGSGMLKESAEWMEGKTAGFSAAEAKTNVKGWEWEVLMKAGDSRAGALEKELGMKGIMEMKAREAKEQVEANEAVLAAKTKETVTKVAAKAAAMEPALEGKIGPVKYFGLEVQGARIVYVVDHSGSTLDSIDFVKKEVGESVAGLREEQAFNVLYCCVSTTPTFPKMQLATAEAKKEFAEKAKNIHVQGFGEDLLVPFGDAFEAAFRMKPDTIIFMTDGHFDPRLLDTVKRLNARKQVQVHTVALFNHDPSYEDQLKEMAKENGGKYTFVSEQDVVK